MTAASARRAPVVAVVGGGIAGLAAAWELAAGPAGAPGVEVHVLESGDRLGGKLQSAEFEGRTVDLGADAFLARRPEAAGLCDELGLHDELVAVGASGAALWARGRLRAMPAGLNLGVPDRWGPLARSGILAPGGVAQAAVDLVRPHRGVREVTGDRAVGEIVASRLGREVVDLLVDPLVGGIHAGGVDDLSAAATFPQLLAADRQRGSLMRNLGRSRPPAPATTPATPLFWSLAGSTARLGRALAEALAARGVHLHTGVAVDALRRTGPDGPGWALDLGGAGIGGGPTLAVDGAVLAVPAGSAARLLAEHAPVAAGLLAEITTSSVAVVTLTVPAAAVRAPLTGTGFLVPRAARVDGRTALVTGCTYLGRKWPHLARPGDELLRLSVGRHGDTRPDALDDAELVDAAFAELARILGVDGRPTASLVTRWDGAFPQYAVGHLVRVDRIERSVAELPGLAVAGAAYRGVGIPACVGSGRTAARGVLAALDPTPARSDRG